MEFHVSRKARDLYQFDQALFSLSGSVVFADFRSARLFAQKMNQKRDLLRFPEQAVRAGQINAMGMIDEIMHYVVDLFRQQKNLRVASQALEWLDGRLGQDAVDKAFLKFADDFPTLAVYHQELSPKEYLAGQTDGVPNREVLLEEMLMLWIENSNPALTPYIELFDATDLEKDTAYKAIISSLHDFFDTQPTFGPDSQNLVDMLRSPAIAVPHSLTGQLEYIRERWGSLLGRFLYRLLGSLDLIKEEERFFFQGGPGPALVPVYGRFGAEPERFSPDKEWMPRLVLMAKNAYVWLDQLSKKHQRSITRLDQIPDEELEALARRGFSGLWLIGLWERSRASEKIKKLCGNPDAVASAYSLYDYRIADDLGGEGAYQNLRDHAWRFGVRLGSDMVPNHVGIDSPWVVEHPDWFVSLDTSPFPSYSFNGPDLSEDSRVGIYLEDHYYNRSDAAVVFKRVDRSNGSEKYIYHGNDGTSMPWNDTAQLNYLNPEVRETIIQTILNVARRFPVIRFDAAMTLAKKHYQRLWFPEPGGGGAIPSRAEYGLTREQFDAVLPQEFWREVVDRVAAEAPDTLLLAEAFWLMEGYFVRTLGMHRVYNSAFMNMMRDEDNAKYRMVMKNTLEFEPEILKRFVNFMNNPDERTAVDQFGKGDKYFGICTVMATFPGLPMFGHGQIEGYSEKYGMEFRRSYWDETPDEALVQRHEREIFPLLHKRRVFAGVDNFLLYDFYTPEGNVNEDVYAYSNSAEGEHGLVIYHNKYASTHGWVRTSVGFSVKNTQGDGRRVVQRTLGEGLGLHAQGDYFTIFREQASGLEYLRNSQELCEQGLYVELNAYKAYVFLDFREVQDNEWRQYGQLNEYLNGRGVPSIQEALQELVLQPVLHPFQEVVNADLFHRLLEARISQPEETLNRSLIEEAEWKAVRMLGEIKGYAHGSGDENEIGKELRRKLETLLQLPVLATRYPLPGSRRYAAAMEYLTQNLREIPTVWTAMFGWLFVHELGKLITPTGYEEISRSWIDEWRLGRVVVETVQALGMDEGAAWHVLNTLKMLTDQQHWFEGKAADSTRSILEGWLKSSEIQRFLGVNRYKDVLWFNKEAFDELLWWMMLLAIVDCSADPQRSSSEVIEQVITSHEIVTRLGQASEESGYQVEKLLDALAD